MALQTSKQMVIGKINSGDNYGVYLPNISRQDVTHGQFLKEVKLVQIQSFPSSRLVA